MCDGELLVNDVISLSMTLRRRRGAPAAALSTIDDAPFWWVPNAAGLERYVRAAGFEVLARGRPYLERNGAGAVKLGWRARGAASLRRMLVLKLGVPPRLGARAAAARPRLSQRRAGRTRMVTVRRVSSAPIAVARTRSVRPERSRRRCARRMTTRTVRRVPARSA